MNKEFIHIKLKLPKKHNPKIANTRWPVQCKRRPSQRSPYPHSHENMHLTSKRPHKNNNSPSSHQRRPGISILMKTHKYEIFTGLFPWESPSLLTFTQFAMDYYHLFHQPSKNTHKSPTNKSVLWIWLFSEAYSNVKVMSNFNEWRFQSSLLFLIKSQSRKRNCWNNVCGPFTICRYNFQPSLYHQDKSTWTVNQVGGDKA